jgi:hypothetical protein
VSKKHTFEYIKQYFKEQECELLEKEYKNNRTKMRYKCNCENISEITFNNFRLGKKCRKCSGSEKHTFQYVKQYFKNHKCKLLETRYKDIDTLIKYECHCSRISKITFYKFKKGQRCKKCGNEKQKRFGKKNHMWNPDKTDEEREKERNLNVTKYKKWRTSVFIRDKRTCQKCFKKSRQINAHHIESWSSNKKLRFIKSNGITFCTNCHIEFHKKYGKGKNNKQQLKEYLKTITPQLSN